MGSRAFSGEVWTNIHPDILRAITEANGERVDGKVGRDSHTRRAEALMQAAFTAPVFCMEAVNGTAANILALKQLLRPWESVLCAAETHINTHECGALEYNLGGKILPIESEDGRVTAEQVSRALNRARRFGYQPGVLALTQPTELGVLYSVEALAALTRCAHENGLRVFVDGARLANALAALDTNLRDMIERPDIDAFTFGGTKCGALFGEMVVLRRGDCAAQKEYLQKQSMQHLDKSKFLGAQMECLLAGEHWRAIAAQMNARAAQLAARLADQGLAPAYPVETNMVFCHLSEAQMRRVNTAYDLGYWDGETRLVRFCASHETTAEDVDRLAALLG